MGNSSSTPPPPGLEPLPVRDSDSSDDENERCGCSNPFAGFCSPRDYTHAPSALGAKTKRWGSDSLGTPVQATPPNIRRARMERLGLLSSNYDGLEKEADEENALDGNNNGARIPPAPPSSAGAKFGKGSIRDSRTRPLAMPPPGNHTPGTCSLTRKSMSGVIGSLSSVRSAELHEGPNGEIELNKKYEMKEVLGVGSTSTCHKCVERATGVEFACKIIDKHDMEHRFKGMLQQFQTEINVLRNLHHPNIINLQDVYITNDKIFIVMELMSGGELFDYVVERGTLTEEEASQIIRKVTSAIVYMHQQNIIHRDLKPENLLLTHKPRTPGEIPEVKIIDFGLSKLMQEAPVASSFLGTRGYLAPEMLQRQKYTRAVDAWALGVITYVLLCGCLPFDDDSASIPSEDILRSRFVLRFPRWAKNLSPSARDLLQKLLEINPRHRYTAEQALSHVSTPRA